MCVHFGIKVWSVAAEPLAVRRPSKALTHKAFEGMKYARAINCAATHLKVVACVCGCLCVCVCLCV